MAEIEVTKGGNLRTPILPLINANSLLSACVIQCWRLIDDPPAIKRNYTKLVHPIHGIFEGTSSEFADKFCKDGERRDGYVGRFSDLMKGSREAFKGWRLIDEAERRKETKNLLSEITPCCVADPNKNRTTIEHPQFGKFEGNSKEFCNKYVGEKGFENRRACLNSITDLMAARIKCYKQWVLVGQPVVRELVRLYHPEFGQFVGTSSEFADKFANETMPRKQCIATSCYIMNGRWTVYKGWRRLCYCIGKPF